MTETTHTADLDRRQRLVEAFSRAAAEYGYADVEIETVVRYAGLSAADFEQQFDGREEILVAAQEAFFERLWLGVVAVCEGTGSWSEKVRDAVSAVIESVVEASALARVFAIEAPGLSPRVAERQFATLNRLADLLRAGRHEYPDAADLPDSTERGLVGGTVSVVTEHLLVEDSQAIPNLREQIVEFLLRPYLGEEGARQVAATG